MADSHLSTLLLIWLGAIAALTTARSWRRIPGTGLVLAYVLNLWLIHWVAPALYLLPWYRNLDPWAVEAGLALCCWLAWRSGSKGKLIIWLTVTALLPFITIVTRGFIGYGAVAALTVLIFVSGHVKPRLLVVVAGVIIAYVGFSVFVTYMRD